MNRRRFLKGALSGLLGAILGWEVGEIANAEAVAEEDQSLYEQTGKLSYAPVKEAIATMEQRATGNVKIHPFVYVLPNEESGGWSISYDTCQTWYDCDALGISVPEWDAQWGGVWVNPDWSLFSQTVVRGWGNRNNEQ